MITADARPPAAAAPAIVVSERGKWMALTAALLGWMFDGFEIGMFPLVGDPALRELLGDHPGANPAQWFGVITAVFLVGAASGGVLFGWLGDRIGRVRAMSLSIFTYAIFTGLCGFATEAWHIAVLRFIASLGMGGEWSLGVALVNEIWPQRSRALIAGLIGAASNVGIGLVPVLSLTLLTQLDDVRAGMTSIGLGAGVVEPLLRNDAWRLLMIAGALPALLIFFIRLFVPESGRWEEQRAKGATSHWATVDLLGVLAGTLGAGMVITVWSPLVTSPVLRTLGTIVGLAVALAGFLYPVIMYLRRASAAAGEVDRAEGAHRPAGAVLDYASDRADVRRLDDRRVLKLLLLGAGLSGVALLGTWGSLQWAARWAIELTKGPTSATPRSTRRSRCRSARSSARSPPPCSPGGSGGGSSTPRSASARSPRCWRSTSSTTATAPASCSPSSSPAGSPRRSTGGSRSTCPSCSPPASARPARASPTTSAACWPRSARCRPRR